MEFDSTLQSKGEPALEIIVEKDDAVSNGQLMPAYLYLTSLTHGGLFHMAFSK